MNKKELSAIQLANKVNRDEVCALNSGISLMQNKLIAPNYSWDPMYPEKEMVISEAIDSSKSIRRRVKEGNV